MANYCYPSILPEVHRSCHNNMFTGLIHDFKINIKHAIKPLTNVMLKGICKQLWKLQKKTLAEPLWKRMSQFLRIRR